MSRTTQDDQDLARCESIVTEWLKQAEVIEAASSRSAKSRGRRLAAVIGDPGTADLTMALTDEVLRIDNPKQAAKRFSALVAEHSAASLSLVDRVMLRVGALVAPVLPRIVMPLVLARLKGETSNTIVSSDISRFDAHRHRREADGFQLNVNLLGESILGEGEATRRLHEAIAFMERGATKALSVKLSSVAANLSTLAFDATVERLVETLRPLYQTANKHGVFVNLDMEEYRDLSLTCEVFRRLLSEEAFRMYTGGIVLQAYLPDAHAEAHILCEWASERVAKGGAPIRIRIVKGANLQMELVDAEVHGWAAATYPTKLDVDASWKLLVEAILNADFDGAAIVGAASHNLFDVAWATLQSETLAERGQAQRLRFEMLEGMADAQARAVKGTTGNLLMYTPVVNASDFVSAIGYLTRRLDENTGHENFLRALIDLSPGSASYRDQRDRFAAALRHRHEVSTTSRRSLRIDSATGFANVADSDVTQPEVRDSLTGSLSQHKPGFRAPVIESTEVVDAVVDAARQGGKTWGELTHVARADHLRMVAHTIAESRSEIVGLLAHEGSKTLLEGDVEVSEAVDFANYYATLAEELDAHGDASSPLGVVLVTPPWNFPYAITMGGVLASLAAGNAVILKPTPQCPSIAARVASDCWKGGIPASALHLLAVPDDDTGKHLVTHDGVDAVVLTGAIETARMFLGWKPNLRLLAETSGKNSMIIMGSADIDLAIKDLVKSAFGHAGQKCSAASLAIVDCNIYDNPTFRRRLADAVNTLLCGDSTDPRTDVPGLLETPSNNLLRALTLLEAGEEWIVSPRHEQGSNVWTPGVRLGVTEGSWFHLNECFGPVLGVMRADDLDHAIRLQNAVPFGLTAGLHSLDESEVIQWVDRVEAGNLYVNRTITGAIVRRQPFGGWKQSCVGPGSKAGGPSYVHVLRRWKAGSSASRLAGVTALAATTNDPSGLHAETNVLRYRQLPQGVVAWVNFDAAVTNENQLEMLRTAAAAADCHLTVFRSGVDTEAAVIHTMDLQHPDRLRILGTASDTLRRAAHERGIRIDDDPMSEDPAIELVRFTREQAVTVTQHRHGRPQPMRWS